MTLQNNKLENILSKKEKFLHFIPRELEWLKGVKKIEYKGVNLNTDYIIDIINTFIMKSYFKEDSRTQLSSKILKEKYGSNYNYYINYMLEKRWIKLIRDYLRGTNSRIYCFNERLLESDIIRVFNGNKILLKKWKNRYHDFQINSDSGNIDKIVREKLIYDLHHIKIDYDKSIEYINRNLSEDKNVYDKNLYSVESINSGHIFYHFDNYGRLHTNFTILKSFIRKNYLKIDGEGTIELDIKNSQPLILSRLIRDIGGDEVSQKEYSFFKELVDNGEFYNYIQKNLNITKKESKSVVFNVFFGKNWNNKYDRFFKNHFPTIYNWIKLYKRDSGNYKSLSWKLQSIESDLIFNKIIKEIILTNSDIKLITVHDSIVVKETDYILVKKIFEKHLDIFKNRII